MTEKQSTLAGITMRKCIKNPVIPAKWEKTEKNLSRDPAKRNFWGHQNLHFCGFAVEPKYNINWESQLSNLKNILVISENEKGKPKLSKETFAALSRSTIQSIWGHEKLLFGSRCPKTAKLATLAGLPRCTWINLPPKIQPKPSKNKI